MTYEYRLSYLRVLSDIELPELMTWDGRWSHATADIVFRLGSVPSDLDCPDEAGAGFQVKSTDRFLLTLADETRILVKHGREVTIELSPRSNLVDARAVLMGPIQAVLWHQRGLLPLHASVIDLSGNAIAFAGPSGVGKSTIAAAFCAKGHAVLADDICIIDTTDGARVLPSTPRLRLWRDALEYLGIGPDGLIRALSRREKYLIEGTGWVGSEPRRLAAIVLLSRGSGRDVMLERLQGARSFSTLHTTVHMLSAACALRLQPAVFTALTNLLEAGTTVWQLRLPDSHNCLHLAVEKILAALNGPAAGPVGL